MSEKSKYRAIMGFDGIEYLQYRRLTRFCGFLWPQEEWLDVVRCVVAHRGKPMFVPIKTPQIDSFVLEHPDAEAYMKEQIDKYRAAEEAHRRLIEEDIRRLHEGVGKVREL